MIDLQTAILIILGVWVLVLSVFVYLIFSFFRRLSKNIKEPDLRKTLDKLFSKEVKNTSALKEVQREINRIKDNGLGHIQKVALVRFNPFKEIGGDHSFCLALLDDRLNGVIITTLHTRERTRVYSKSIEKGKCKLELSDEEKKALLKAQKS